MELRTVDPRTLKDNPQNPRRVSPGAHANDQLAANIKAVGILQPPVVRGVDGDLRIKYGHRRVAAAIAAGLAEILVLVCDVDESADAVHSVSENVCRAEMGPVDQWRAIEALVSADWTEDAIAAALALPVRTLRKLRLLAHIHPGMLDQMAMGDMPNESWLRAISAASPDEQAVAWKKLKPKKDAAAAWHEIARTLTKRTMPARAAKFGTDLEQAYGITWTDDLFAPSNEDSRTTIQVEEFLAAQQDWLANHLPKNGHVAELGQYNDVKLPPRAMRTYGKPRKDDHIACYVDVRTGEVEYVAYSLPIAQTASSKNPAAVGQRPSSPRPPISAKGTSMIGDIRTEALHKALTEASFTDDVLIGFLVLALGSRNVRIESGDGASGPGEHARTAARLTEGGVLTQDLELLRTAARDMLVQVLSCRDRSQSGMNARYAGDAIGADLYLPNMATQEFLACLTKTALEETASRSGVAPKATGKQTRAALIAHVGQGSLIHPAARFAPTAAELEANPKPRSTYEPSEAENADLNNEGDVESDTIVETGLEETRDS